MTDRILSADPEPNCVVMAADGSARLRAQTVAQALALPLVREPSKDARVALVIGSGAAWLQQLGDNVPGPVTIDFAAPEMLHRRKGGQNELLGRAVGVKQERHPRVIDATAGLGRDGFVLADLGCEVTLFERSPVLAWLLEQARESALISAYDHIRAAAERLSVVHADSTTFDVPNDAVIYLDPMFPERRNSAAVKKDLALLQCLHDDFASGDDALMAWARTQPASRIVVKRPAKAEPILGARPSHSLKGKAVRFDVYVNPRGDN